MIVADAGVPVIEGPADGSPGRDASTLVQRLRLALNATRQIAKEMTVDGRVTRFLESAAPVAGARFAVMVVHADDGDRAYWGTSDPLELAAVQSVLAARSDLPTAVLPHAQKADERLVEHTFTGQGWPEPPILVMPLDPDLGASGELYLVGRPGGGTFCADDEEVLREFVAVAAVGLENAQQYEELGRREEWLRALATVSQGLLSSSADDETQVWQQIADQVHRLAAARTVTISTPSEDDPDRLEIRVAAGVGAADLPGATYPLAGSLNEYVMSAGTGRVVDARDWKVSHTSVAPEIPVGALLAMPLTGQVGPRGAILVSRTQDQLTFSAGDVAMAQDFANQAVIALELAESRAAQQRLLARTEVERLAETFQDQMIQRLFSIGLLLESGTPAVERRPWLDRAIEEINHTITVVRSSLASSYGVR